MSDEHNIYETCSDKNISRALDYVRDEAANIGRLKGLTKVLEAKRKAVRGQMILASTETSDSRRIADAESSDEYMAVIHQIDDAETELATLQAKMTAAYAKIDVWRSLNARLNKGHL